MKRLCLLVGVIALSGCADVKESIQDGIDLLRITPHMNFCEVYDPMLPSRRDTEETAKHLMKYHNLWNDNCKTDNTKKY